MKELSKGYIPENKQSKPTPKIKHCKLYYANNLIILFLTF